MAHRVDVNYPAGPVWALLALALLALASCSIDVPTTPLQSRGRVIDQDTLQPIAGAIVVANYMGGGANHGTSCNRVESAVSDENGWFSVPVDPRDSPPLFEAYHPQYAHGRMLRQARNGVGGKIELWHVAVLRVDGSIDHYEPTIFASEREAKEASGENRDVYLKKTDGTREARISELGRLPSATSCLAPPKASPGLIPFLEAILAEERSLGLPSSRLESTLGYIERARQSNSGTDQKTKVTP
jgi:hypothetical protein